MSRSKFGVLGFVCLSILLCGQAFAGDDDRIEKLFARAAENVAKGTSLATVSFDGQAGDDVLAFSWGVTNSGLAGGTGGGSGAGKSVISDFAFVKKLSKSSADLFKACAQGQHFK